MRGREGGGRDEREERGREEGERKEERGWLTCIEESGVDLYQVPHGHTSSTILLSSEIQQLGLPSELHFTSTIQGGEGYP